MEAITLLLESEASGSSLTSVLFLVLADVELVLKDI